MRLLDLFCGAGGCSVGYQRAGFEVVGVDSAPQPRYPFTFHQADALEFLAAHGREFDAIHASPPCQAYSPCRRIGNARPGHPSLIEPTREILEAIGQPWVIENVPGAPLARGSVMLCGSMFSLPLIRHRYFEASSLLLSPGECSCQHGTRYGVYAGKVTIIGSRAASYRDAKGRTHYRPKLASLTEGQRAMGIDWMNRYELSQAIPPAYTELIGRRLMSHLRGGAPGVPAQ